MRIINKFKHSLTVFTAFMLMLTVAHQVYANPIGAVTTATKSQLCISGYSSTVRPSVSYTSKIKRRLVREQGGKVSDYELDHFIPIAIGGDPKSLENLWLQLWPEAKRKDVVENKLHRDLCAGRISLIDAQNKMRAWQ